MPDRQRREVPDGWFRPLGAPSKERYSSDSFGCGQSAALGIVHITFLYLRKNPFVFPGRATGRAVQQARPIVCVIPVIRRIDTARPQLPRRQPGHVRPYRSKSYPINRRQDIRHPAWPDISNRPVPAQLDHPGGATGSPTNAASSCPSHCAPRVTSTSRPCGPSAFRRPGPRRRSPPEQRAVAKPVPCSRLAQRLAAPLHSLRDSSKRPARIKPIMTTEPFHPSSPRSLRQRSAQAVSANPCTGAGSV